MEEKAKKEAEEKAKLEETEGKESKTEEGKEAEASEPAQDKDTRAAKETAESTDKDKEEKEKEKTEERKPEPAELAQAMKDPVEQKPKEAEGNKDPGGSGGPKLEPETQEASNPRQPATHSSTDGSRQGQNGRCSSLMEPHITCEMASKIRHCSS